MRDYCSPSLPLSRLTHTSPSLSHTTRPPCFSHTHTLTVALSHPHPHSRTSTHVHANAHTERDRHRRRGGQADADILVTEASLRSRQGSREWGGVSAVVGERLHARRGCLRARGLWRRSGGLVLTHVLRVLRVLRRAGACQRLASSLETKPYHFKRPLSQLSTPSSLSPQYIYIYTHIYIYIKYIYIYIYIYIYMM
jgi:hypothetical protein